MSSSNGVPPQRNVRRAACGLAMLAAFFVARAGGAQPSPADRALAQSLFDQGRQLMADGANEQACPKFEASQRLDPGGGTLLNLARCHEAVGKTASAWAEFNEGLSQAIRDGRLEREKLCRERIAALAERLVRLKVSPGANKALQGFAATVDGTPLGEAAWDVPLPVDPGAHVVGATAANHGAWSTTIQIGERDGQIAVEIPPLERAPASPVAVGPSLQLPPPPDKAPVPSGWQSRHTAFVVGGGGVAALAVGTAFGIVSLSKASASDNRCNNGKCSAEGLALYDEARSAAWGSNIGFGVGLVALGIATYLYFKSDGPPKAAPSAWLPTGEGIQHVW